LGLTPLQSGQHNEAQKPTERSTKIEERHYTKPTTRPSIGRTPERMEWTTPPPPSPTTRPPLAHSMNPHSRLMTDDDDHRDQTRATAEDRELLARATPTSTATARFPAAPSTPRRQCRRRPHFEVGTNLPSREEPVKPSAQLHRCGDCHTCHAEHLPRMNHPAGSHHITSLADGAAARRRRPTPHCRSQHCRRAPCIIEPRAMTRAA
jgi:hypothetical protein